jgi:hypothetical protein
MKTTQGIWVVGIATAGLGLWMHVWWLLPLAVLIIAWGWFRERPRRTSHKAPAPPDHFRGVRTVGSTEDFEQAVSAGQLVLIGDAGRTKWLRFGCPCGCGETIALNLMQSHSPRWTVERHDDATLSVTPSVDSTTCGSHFWIRRNRVAWVDPMPARRRQENSS